MRGFRLFWRDVEGTAAITFGLMFAVLIGGLGLAYDYGNCIRIRSKLQTAVDAGVLSAARIGVDDALREQTFTSYVNANFPIGLGTSRPAFTFTYTSSAGATGTATLSQSTPFMNFFRVASVPISVQANARVTPLDLEIVFVLDISGSMRAPFGTGSRMDVLKAAVTKMVNDLVAVQQTGQSIKFSVVPFTMAVNIGTANAGLVDATADPLFAGTTWGGCVLERTGANVSTDVYNACATDGSGRWPAYIWPPEPNSNNSCLNPSDGTNAAYRSVEPAPLGLNAWKPGPNFNCPRYPMQRLSTTPGNLLTQVASLTPYPNMGTTIGPALGWALRLISPTGPFGDGAPFSAATRKVVIAVTDGELVTDGVSCASAKSTGSAYKFDPTRLGLVGRNVGPSGPANDSFTPYGYLLDSDPYNKGLSSALDADKELDRLALVACSAIKSRSPANPIELYTIAASTGAGPGTRAQSMLSSCATDGSHFVYAADGTAMAAAFDNISQRVLNLRLTH